jgi:hypothetical protein
MRKKRYVSYYTEVIESTSFSNNDIHHYSFILQEAIFRVVSTVLHAENINFANGAEDTKTNSGKEIK